MKICIPLISLSLSLLLSTSCVVNKPNIETKSNDFLIINDTIIIENTHCHNDRDLFCSWVKNHKIIITDTIYKPKLY